MTISNCRPKEDRPVRARAIIRVVASYQLTARRRTEAHRQIKKEWLSKS
jgi:hypothetical protein